MCYSHTGSNHLPQSYMVLRSLYGLRPEILVWVGRTSTRLDFKVFQNINLLKSINYILQLTHNEVDGGSSHPRQQQIPLPNGLTRRSTNQIRTLVHKLCEKACRITSPVNRGTKEPPPQRTKRARRKSSGGAAVDWGSVNDSALNIGTSAGSSEADEEEKFRRGCG